MILPLELFSFPPLSVDPVAPLKRLVLSPPGFTLVTDDSCCLLFEATTAAFVVPVPFDTPTSCFPFAPIDGPVRSLLGISFVDICTDGTTSFVAGVATVADVTTVDVVTSAVGF